MYSFINNGYTNITRGDNMKPKKDIKPKGKTREKCGDCFYNGSCTLPLSECFFIIKEKRKKA